MCHAGWEESSRARRLLLYTPLPPPGNAPGACETARRWVKGKGWEGRERQTCLTYLFKPTAGGADYSCRAKRCVCVWGQIFTYHPPLLSLLLCVADTIRQKNKRERCACSSAPLILLFIAQPRFPPNPRGGGLPRSGTKPDNQTPLMGLESWT